MPLIIEQITDDSANAVAEQISERLFQFNCEKSGINDYTKFTVVVRNDTNEIVGGISGWSRWNWAHVDVLWLEEQYRGGGLGEQLIQSAESIAIQRGCSMIDLDTFNFQAPGLYKKLGYIQQHVLQGIGIGIQKYFFKKELPVT